MDGAAQMGLSLLALESYFEADMFLRECLNENERNGIARLGLLCTKLKDKTLYDALTAQELPENISVKDHAAEMVNCMGELTRAVECAVNRSTAENILHYLFLVIRYVVEEKKANLGLDKIFSFVAQYDSAIYDELLEYMRENVENIATVCSASEQEAVYNDLVKYALYENTRVKTMESIVTSYSRTGDLSNAKTWNDKVLEIDGSNLEAILRKLYFSVGASDIEHFKIKQLNCSVGDVIIPFLQISIKKLSKTDSDRLLDFISGVELFCMNRNAFDHAEIYFDFVCEYQFPAKTAFLEKHHSYIKRLANANRTAFFEKYMAVFEKYMSVMSDESVNLCIKKRLVYADAAKTSRFFDDAEKIYRSILLLKKENVDVWNGIFSCHLNFDGETGDGIQWEKFSVSEFEKILSSCSTRRKKTAILKYYAQACVLSARAQTSDHAACCEAFDSIVKYFPDGKSEEVCGFIEDFADEFLKNGIFDLALKYANLLVEKSVTDSIKARYILLFAMLECKNEDDFKHCEKFDKTMPEYKALLLACRTDSEALKYYISLVRENENCITQIKSDRKKATEKSKQCLKRGLLGLIIPISTILFFVLHVRHYDWESYEDFWYDEMQFIVILEIVFWVAIPILVFMGIRCSFLLIGHAIDLKKRNCQKMEIDKTMKKMKTMQWMTIIGFVFVILELLFLGSFSLVVLLGFLIVVLGGIISAIGKNS